MGVTVGKNGKMYILNADNLGGKIGQLLSFDLLYVCNQLMTPETGFRTGSGGGDSVIQTIPTPGGGAVFSGVGSYPLEGGYIYVSPSGYNTVVYSFGHDASGNPLFTRVANTNELNTGRPGTGIPTVTSDNGRPG